MYLYLFIFLAGVSNAFMDTFLFRVDRSIFKNMNLASFLTIELTAMIRSLVNIHKIK